MSIPSVDVISVPSATPLSPEKKNSDEAIDVISISRKIEEFDGNEHHRADKMHTMNSPSFVPIDYCRDDTKKVDDFNVVNAEVVTVEQLAGKVTPQMKAPVVVVTEIFTTSKVVDPNLIIEEDSGVAENIMLEETHRVKLPETPCKSPFVTEFDSVMSIIPAGMQRVIFDRKHLLESDIDIHVPSDLLKSFLKWIKQRKTNKEQLSLDLGVYVSNVNGWFSELCTVGKALSSTL